MKCRACGLEWHMGRCEFAINKAAINTPNAINTKDAALPQVGEANPALEPASGVVRTANRRSREAYNAYMREYMRKRRVG